MTFRIIVERVPYLEVPEGIGRDEPGLLLPQSQVLEGGAVGR